MTIEQVKTYLLLGVKLKREHWEGYIYQEGGTLYNYDAVNDSRYTSTLANWFYSQAEAEWGKWEVVNE